MAQITPNNLAFSAGGVFTAGGSVTFGFENVPGDPDAPATLKPIYTDTAQTIAATNPQPLDSDAKYQQSATGVLYGSPPFSVLVRDMNGVQVSYDPSYTPNFTANAYDVGTGAGEVPTNSILGTASLVDTGTGAGEVPLSEDLGMDSGETNYTTGNLNPNVFAAPVGDVIGIGFPLDNNTVIFYLPISSNSTPTSITTVSSFGIWDSQRNFIKTSTGVALSTASSSKIAVILVEVSGTVLVADDMYQLVGNNATSSISSITVNF